MPDIEERATAMAGVTLESSDGLALHVVDEGPDDGVAVVLLHGITQSTDTWDWLAAELRDSHRVVRLDFRGHGRSGRADRYDTYEGYVADAVATCEHVGRPCVVVGHSLGGGTALAVAQRQPELVAAVVGEEPALTGARNSADGGALGDMFAGLRAVVPDLQANGTAVAELAAFQRGVPTADGATMGEVFHDDAIDAVAVSLLALDAPVLDPVLDGTLSAPFDLDSPIGRPGIVLAADPASPDCLAKPELLDRLAQASPSLEIRVVPGAGHRMHDTRAHRDAVRAAVVEAVDKWGTLR